MRGNWLRLMSSKLEHKILLDKFWKSGNVVMWSKAQHMISSDSLQQHKEFVIMKHVIFIMCFIQAHDLAQVLI